MTRALRLLNGTSCGCYLFYNFFFTACAGVVPSKRWNTILQNRLAVLSGEGEIGQLAPSSGNVNLGNLWIQLHKYFHGADAAGSGSATFFGIVCPNQEPDQMFSSEAFMGGPYAGKTIREVLGVKRLDPRRVRPED